MILTRKLLNKFEQSQRWLLPESLKNFLLDRYSDDDDLLKASEFDLFHWIRKDVQLFEEGKLDLKIRSKLETLAETNEHLRKENHLLFTKLEGTYDTIYELEKLLKKHGIPLPECCEIQF